MKKSQLKQLLKPIVKECINEALTEHGLLSNIISEEKTNGDSDFSSDRSLMNDKNALGVNSNFEALVVKKIHSDTGESVGKTPDLNQQKLNQHIREYQKLALEELQ